MCTAVCRGALPRSRNAVNSVDSTVFVKRHDECNSDSQLFSLRSYLFRFLFMLVRLGRRLGVLSSRSVLLVISLMTSERTNN